MRNYYFNNYIHEYVTFLIVSDSFRYIRFVLNNILSFHYLFKYQNNNRKNRIFLWFISLASSLLNFEMKIVLAHATSLVKVCVFKLPKDENEHFFHRISTVNTIRRTYESYSHRRIIYNQTWCDHGISTGTAFDTWADGKSEECLWQRRRERRVRIYVNTAQNSTRSRNSRRWAFGLSVSENQTRT